MIKTYSQKNNLSINYMNYENINGIRTRIYQAQKLSKTFQRRVTKAYKAGWNPNQNIINILDENNLVINEMTGRLLKINDKFRLQRIKNDMAMPFDLELLNIKNLYYKPDTKRFVKRSRANAYKKKGYQIINNRLVKTDTSKIIEYPISFHKQQPAGLVTAEEDQVLYVNTTIKNWFKSNFDLLSSWEKIIIVFKSGNQIISQDIESIAGLSFKKMWSQIYPVFWSYSPDGCWLMSEDEVRLIIGKESPFMGQYIEQIYADNLLSNCIPKPIIDFLETKIEKSKSKGTKKKYKTIVNKARKWEQDYKEGIPENKLQDFVNDLNIDLSISLPIGYSYNDKKIMPYKTYSTERKKYGIKHFKFINTRFNHVDSLTCETRKKTIIDTPQEMESIINDIRKENRIVPYYKHKNIYLKIDDINNSYILKSDYAEAKAQFIKDNNLDFSFIDCKSEIGKFVQNSVQFPCCMDINNKFIVDEEIEVDPLDFNSEEQFENYEIKENTINYNDNDFDNIQMWDMQKAFYNFKKCPYYDGFAISCYAFVSCKIPIEDAINNEAGFYMLSEIDMTDAPLIIQKMNIVYERCIVPHFVIKFLVDKNITFKIIGGVYATKGDIKMNKNLLPKEDGIRHFQRMFGSFVTDNKWRKIMFDNTDKQLLSTAFYQIQKQDLESMAVENTYNKTIEISFKKDVIKNRCHISSYVYWYSSLTLIEQCLKFDYEDIIRVNVDAIYIHNNNNKYTEMIGSFENESDREGIKSKPYLIGNMNCINRFMIPNREHDIKLRNDTYFKNVRVKCILGAGGTGKTYSLLHNKSFEKINYVAHSNKLCKSIENEYSNIQYTAPYQHIITDNPTLKTRLLNKSGLFIFDEVSFYSFQDIKTLLKYSERYSLPFYFCGDIGYQVDPVSCKKTYVDRLGLFKNKEYKTKNYRFKNDAFHAEAMEQVRKMIEKNNSLSSIVNYIIKTKNYKRINKEKFLENMKINDILLCSEHQYINQYNNYFKNKFTNIKKWLCKSNTKEYSNGEIVISENKPMGSVECYGYTIHAFQGETIDKPNKLYIDLRRLKKTNVLYTALSRAKFKEQIRFIV